VDDFLRRRVLSVDTGSREEVDSIRPRGPLALLAISGSQEVNLGCTNENASRLVENGFDY